MGNFKVKIKRNPRYVEEDKCTGCGVCRDKCPTKANNEFDEGLGIRKAIYTPFPQAVPNIPVIDKAHCTFFLKGKCRACEKLCEAKAINFEQKEKIVEVDVGSIIVTTGFDSLDPSAITQYGYGRYDNVYSRAAVRENEQRIRANQRQATAQGWLATQERGHLALHRQPRQGPPCLLLSCLLHVFPEVLPHNKGEDTRC